MDPTFILESVATIGLTSALVVFFVWISWKREERLANRVTELEHALTESVLTALRDNTAALERLNAVLHENRSEIMEVQGAVNKVRDDLGKRPCAMNSKAVLEHFKQVGVDIHDRDKS